MAKRKPNVDAFRDCLKTVESFGDSCQWNDGPVRSWNELTESEREEAMKPHPFSKYPSFNKFTVAGIIDPLFSALERAFAEFPSSQIEFADSNSTGEAIGTVDGERRYLASVAAHLLRMMNDAGAVADVNESNRFAFEAGILWNMAGGTSDRRIADSIREGMEKGRKTKATEASESGESIRNELREILWTNSNKSLTWARELLAKRGTHGSIATIKRHSKGMAKSNPVSHRASDP